MNKDTLLALVLLGAAAFFYNKQAPVTPPAPTPRPIVPIPVPTPRKPCPLLSLEAAGKPQLGSLTSPVKAICDLPGSEKRRNVGGRDGAGLCVFTSIEYAARYQNEPRLMKLQDDMRKEPGGGWPEKVDLMIAKYGKGSEYIQHTTGDLSFIKAAFNTGRPVCITYGGYDMHYKGYVAHMVLMAHIDDEWAAITDNNFPGEDELVWMSVSELEKRWKAGGGGWAIVLLNPPPPPMLKGS